MRKRDVLALAGVIVSAAGVVALGFLLKKFLSNAKVEKFEENLVAKIVEGSPIKGVMKAKARRQKSTKAGKQESTKARKQKSKKVVKLKTLKRVEAKGGNAEKLLEVMKKGQEYSQVQLGKVSKIPYRSVRRYIDSLIKQKKVEAKGYGKGKRFVKVL